MPTPRRHANHAARQAAYRERQAEARSNEWASKGMPSLPALATVPGHPRWQALIRQASLLLETVQEEMQPYYDHRTETWQESERGADFLERLEALQEVQSAVDDLRR